MVPLFETIITEEAKSNVKAVLDSGFVNQGTYVTLFEQELTKQLELYNPVTTNSCTSALHLSLILAGVKPGDKVILPAQTFIATGLAVLMCGAEPVFCDIDKYGNIDAGELVNLPELYDGKVKAIICVHWGGFPCNMHTIDNIAHNLDIPVIEDAAHALGAKYYGDYIGHWRIGSNFTCFSLQAIKTLTTGDGGILCCHNDRLLERAIKLRWFGIDKEKVVRNSNGERLFDIEELGYKYHMNNISAALGLGNLQGIKERIEKRREFAETYNSRLSNVPGIIHLPKSNNPYIVPSYWLYTVLVENRNSFILKLREAGVAASTVDTRIDKKTLFKRMEYDLPGQDFFEAHQVSIPCTSTMTAEQQEKIIEIIKSGW